MAQEMEKTGKSLLCSLFSGTAKVRADAELVLPDYKKDVSRVILSEPRARLTKKEIYRDGSSICAALEGTADFCVLYAGPEEEGAGINCAVLHGEFEHTFRIPVSPDQDPADPVGSVEISAENAVCKLLGPRRLSCRCDVEITLSLSANGTAFYYDADTASAPLFVRSVQAAASRIEAAAEEEMTLSEVIRLPRDYPAVEEIVDARAALFPLRAKPVSGGIAFEGLCAIHAVTADAEGTLTPFYQPVNFSASLSVPQAAAGSIVEITLLPGALKFTPESDEGGENKLLRFDAAYTAGATVYLTETLSPGTDAFSSEAYLTVESEPVRFERLLSVTDSVQTLRGEWECEPGDHDADHVEAQIEFKHSYAESGAVVVEAHLNARYLALDENGDPAGREGGCDLTFTVRPDGELPPEAGERRVEITGDAVNCDVELCDGRAAVSAEVFCRVRISDEREEEILSGMLSAGEIPHGRPGIVFYYPDAGETLWDVARRYHTSPDAIAARNALADGPLPDALQIVPGE